MLLREFANDDPLRVRLIAVASHIKSRILDTNSEETMKTDAFVNLLRRNRIVIDKADLRDLVEQPPLSNIISSLDDDSVTFSVNGGDEDTSLDDMTNATLDMSDVDSLGDETNEIDSQDENPLDQDLGDSDEFGQAPEQSEPMSEYDPNQTVADYNTQSVKQMAKRATSKRL